MGPERRPEGDVRYTLHPVRKIGGLVIVLFFADVVGKPGASCSWPSCPSSAAATCDPVVDNGENVTDAKASSRPRDMFLRAGVDVITPGITSSAARELPQTRRAAAHRPPVQLPRPIRAGRDGGRNSGRRLGVIKPQRDLYLYPARFSLRSDRRSVHTHGVRWSWWPSTPRPQREGGDGGVLEGPVRRWSARIPTFEPAIPRPTGGTGISRMPA